MNNQLSLYMLAANSDDFPATSQALNEPDGLLCAGSNLAVPTLVKAYKKGIFPWYSEGQPLLWWSPDPRMVLLPQNIHISTSMKKWLRKQAPDYHFQMNKNFKQVMQLCATAGDRAKGGGWITQDMLAAYGKLHQAGFAVSFEVMSPEGELVGGLYGIHIGSVLFAESMFSLRTNVSKWLLIKLAQSNIFSLIDCQVYSEHLHSMGACLIARDQFLKAIDQHLKDITITNWCY